jgi:hypothetical protein
LRRHAIGAEAVRVDSDPRHPKQPVDRYEGVAPGGGLVGRVDDDQVVRPTTSELLGR